MAAEVAKVAEVLALVLSLDKTIEDFETTKEIKLTQIRAALCQIGSSFRHGFLKNNIRGPYIVQVLASGKSFGCAQKKWISLKDLIYNCPELNYGTETRAKKALTSDSDTQLEVVQRKAITIATCTVVEATNDAKKKKKKKKKKKDKEKEKERKRKRRTEAIRKQQGNVTDISTKRKRPDDSTTVVDATHKRINSALAETRQAELIDLLRAKPVSADSSLLRVVATDDDVSVVFKQSVQHGIVIGPIGGVMASKPSEEYPCVALENGTYLICQTSSDGFFRNARYADDASANAEINSVADVVTTRTVISGEHLVIKLPIVPRKAVSDPKGYLEAVAKRSLLKRFGEEDGLLRFPSLLRVGFSFTKHRSFAKAFNASALSLCVRVINIGETATTIFANGAKLIVPSGHGLLGPADAFFKCVHDSNISVDVLSSKEASAAEAIEVSDHKFLPETIIALRNISDDLMLRSHSRRERMAVPLILLERPDTGLVRVSSSVLFGSDGLLANCNVMKDDHLTCYAGTLFHQDEYHKLSVELKQHGAGVPPLKPYVVCGRVDFNAGGLGRFLNHAPRGTANCVLEWVEMPRRPGDIHPCGYISVKATRDIKEDEEILLNYGPGHVWNTAKSVREPVAAQESAEKCPAETTETARVEGSEEISL